MKRSFKILIFLLLYLLFSSRSCDDEASQKNWQQHQAELAKDSIRAELQTEILSDQALRATEANAVHKLQDLADYINVFSDMSLDSAFRKKSGEMILNQFIDDKARLTFGAKKDRKANNITLGNFLRSGFGEDLRKARIVFDSVMIKEPLQKSGKENYSGKMAANQFITVYLDTDSLMYPALPITIEFTSSKKNKIIGRDTMQVWELKLGDMK